MSRLRELLRKLDATDLAIPSNFQYGKAIFERDGVEITSEQNDRIEARVGGLSGSSIEGGGGKRRVSFWVEDNTLNTHCNGNPKNHDIFCKHCVALMLTTQSS